jgi:flagellar basal-body rod modification protein FlgD
MGISIEKSLASTIASRGDEAPRSAQIEGQVTDRKGATIGDQLNKMAGIQTEKNLWAEQKTEMGKEAFLKMFLEQLKYQDPMNPVKNEQFSQQMAMFSQLEQQINTNKNLEKMISQQSNMQIAALQLVGKNITADRSVIYHDKNKSSGLNIKIPQDVNELKVEIVDGGGDVLKTFNMGAHEKGDLNFKWDGNRESGQPVESGRYSYRVSGKDLEGKPVIVNTKVDGKVTGVTSSQGIVYLMVGEQKIGLSDVEMITEGSSTATNMPNPQQILNQMPADIAQKLANDEKMPGTKNEGDKKSATVEPTLARAEPPAQNGVEISESDEPSRGDILRSQKSLLDRFDPFNPL